MIKVWRALSLFMSSFSFQKYQFILCSAKFQNDFMFYTCDLWVKDRVQRKQRITWFLTIGLHSWQRSDFITGLWVNCPVLARAASKTIQLSSCHATLFHLKNYSKNNPGLIPSVKIFFSWPPLCWNQESMSESISFFPFILWYDHYL